MLCNLVFIHLDSLVHLASASSMCVHVPLCWILEWHQVSGGVRGIIHNSWCTELTLRGVNLFEVICRVSTSVAGSIASLLSMALSLVLPPSVSLSWSGSGCWVGVVSMASVHSLLASSGELVWDALHVCRSLQIDEISCSMVCREVLEF